MKKCLVIGGGFAGLSSAVYLSKAGFPVEILEASPKAGGRAYSFIDKKSSSVIDNGQHILMGCYYDTLEFFKIIGASGNLSVQKKLEVKFLRGGFKEFHLKAAGSLYPLNLLIGMLVFKALSLQERISLLRFFVKLYFKDPFELTKFTVKEWLESERQSRSTIKSFWEILTFGAMNTSIDKASAQMFAVILKKMFFAGNKAASIVIPEIGLSESYVDNALDYLRQSGGSINFLEQVKKLETNGNKISAVITQNKKINDFDYVISAVPLHSFEKFSPLPGLTDGVKLNYSCIVSIHVWLTENELPGKFYGLIDSPVHWVFNHGDHLTLVISDANRLAEKSSSEIFGIVKSELKKYLLIPEKYMTDYKIIKEKRATFVPSKSVLSGRPGPGTNFSNLYLAGDWTSTGLPATIEGAVISGKTAANLIINRENGN